MAVHRAGAGPALADAESAALEAPAQRASAAQRSPARAPRSSVAGAPLARGAGAPPAAYAAALRRAAVVACPPGNGLDTHRLWEALLAGAVPIVPASALDRALTGLPVWRVGGFGEVTPGALAAKAAELAVQAAAGAFEFERLFAPWWREMFRGLKK